jgi:hypothetical protein
MVYPKACRLPDSRLPIAEFVLAERIERPVSLLSTLLVILSVAPGSNRPQIHVVSWSIPLFFFTISCLPKVNYFKSDEVLVTKNSYQAFVKEEDAKRDVTWYEFSQENISTVTSNTRS